VVIVLGTGAGQRRRISSNSASGIILNAAVTGNANTGPWTTTPDATSVFRIVPSSDFLYYQPGGGATAFYRIDLSLTASPAWTVLSAISSVSNGGNVIYMAASGPFQMIAHRGQGTTTLYAFSIGPNTWTQMPTFWGSEGLTTGGSICMIYGKRKLAVFIQGTTRLFLHDLTTGVLEPAGTLPFVAPAAYDGKRIIHVRTPDGASFLYLMRAGGMEFYRMPLEWP